MKLKQSIQYQLADFIGPVIVYYGVVVALHVVACLAWIFSSIRIYMGGGLSAFSTVFLFICGLCSFHVLIDLLDLPIWGYGSANLFLTLFNLDHLAFGQTLVNTLFSIPFSFVLLALAMTLGYFIVVFLYRLPVKLRIVVGVCAGFVLFFGVPGVKIIDTNLLGEGLRAFFYQHVEPVLAFIWQNPIVLMGTWAVAAVALSAVTWLILRRTTVLR